LKSLKKNQIINKESLNEIIIVYNFLMRLRFKVQLELLKKKLPISNQMETKDLGEIELVILKKSLSIIQLLQSKIGTEFRITN
jgi:CBS domain-containing protein